MAESSYRATFSADTSAFGSAMREMKELSGEMAQEMIADANKIAAATEGSVNKVLAEQIALYERGRKATMRQERAQLDSTWQEKLAAANPASKAGVQAQWDVAKKDFQEQHKLDNIQIDVLRDILDALNQDALHGAGSTEAKERIEALKSGKKLSVEEEYKARVQGKYTDKDDEKKGMRDMWEVAKGTMIGQAVMGMVSAAAKAVSGAVNDPDGNIGAARLLGAIPVIGSTMEAVVGRHMALAETSDRLATSLNSRGANIGMTQGEAHLNDPNLKIDWSKMPKPNERDMNPSSSRYGMTKDQKYYDPYWEKNDEEEKRKSDAEWRNNEANPMSWSYEGAGVDRNKFLETSSKLAPELGTARGLKDQTKSFIDITQGGGISEGTTLGMANLLRLHGGGDLRNTMGQVSGALGDNGESRAIRDKHIAEVVGMGNARYSEGFAKVDPITTAKVKAAFKSNYGEALSSADNIQNMMGAMSKPSDEFQQGINYKIYAEQMSKEGKEASYVGFKKWQEKPENGLMSGKMDYIKQVYGDGELGQIAAKEAFGSKTWEANEVYLKGGSKGLSPEELKKRGASTDFNAEDYKTERMVKQAQMTDEYIKGAFEGFTESVKQIGEAILKNTGVLGKLSSFLEKHN